MSDVEPLPRPEPARKIDAELAQASRLMRRIHASATGRFRELEKRTGVTFAGARLLLHLSRQPDATVSETAATLEIRPSTVSNLLRSLEKAGWVSRIRVPTDQRTVRLRATPAGLEKLAEIGPDAEYFANLLAQLNTDEFRLVSRALRLIAGRLPG